MSVWDAHLVVAPQMTILDTITTRAGATSTSSVLTVLYILTNPLLLVILRDV